MIKLGQTTEFLGGNGVKIIQYPQENCGVALAAAILALERTAWPQDPGETTFPTAPATHLTSFVLMENDRAVCHVGIRKSILRHRGEKYLAYGLSEVVTHPHYRGKGLATQLVRRAAQFMTSQQPDLSIFTCAKERAAFYTRCGWQAIPGACFVGGTKERPFRSDSLGLVTMMRFLSPKGRQHRGDFENTDIIFELGEDQLW